MENIDINFENIGSIIDYMKNKFKSIGNQKNNSRYARNKALSIYSTFDKTLKRREVQDLLETIEKKAKMMKIEILNDKMEIASDTRLTKEFETNQVETKVDENDTESDSEDCTESDNEDHVDYQTDETSKHDCLDGENFLMITHEEIENSIENWKRTRSQSGQLDRNDAKYGTRTPPHKIIESFPNSDIIPRSSNNERILKASAENLASPNEVKYFQEFIPLFEKYKDQEKNNIYSCTNDDVMDIRGDSGFAKFLTIDQYAKLLSVRPKRNAVLPECWHRIIEEYYMESLTENEPKKTISDWLRITESLIIVKDTEEITKLKKYLYRVMLPLIESFLKPIPDISAPNTSEHHYWAEFGHRFFSYALQEFVGLDWRAQVPVLASKYRKNYGLDHAIHKIVEGEASDLLAWSWETGEEILVGEQAGPPTEPNLTKLSMDFFKLYRELRDCVNVRILHAMEVGDINYNNRAVFGILGYLFEIKMLIMWRDGVYIYEEFGSFTIASHSNMIHTMKDGILKLLEFVMVIKEELKRSVEVEYDNDKIQLFKRKFSDIIQTKPSPLKVSR
ncbi:7704_t:CDS:10, partial [Scutellospora calospora]